MVPSWHSPSEVGAGVECAFCPLGSEEVWLNNFILRIALTVLVGRNQVQIQQMMGQFAKSHQYGGASVLGLHFRGVSVAGKGQGAPSRGHLGNIPEEEED